MMCMAVVREEGAHVNISRGLPARQTSHTIRSRVKTHGKGHYPGSLRVLFMEKAKCLPSDVKSSGR